jgi:hypothetical protein
MISISSLSAFGNCVVMSSQELHGICSLVSYSSHIIKWLRFRIKLEEALKFLATFSLTLIYYNQIRLLKCVNYMLNIPHI